MTGTEHLLTRRSCSYIILVAVISLLTTLPGAEAIATDEGWALLDFKNAISDSRSTLRTWKSEDSYPCEWSGISCDKNSHVTSINLRNAGLSGTIALELHRLRKLRILILSENNFSGPIPPQLSEIGTHYPHVDSSVCRTHASMINIQILMQILICYYLLINCVPLACHSYHFICNSSGAATRIGCLESSIPIRCGPFSCSTRLQEWNTWE